MLRALAIILAAGSFGLLAGYCSFALLATTRIPQTVNLVGMGHPR